MLNDFDSEEMVDMAESGGALASSSKNLVEIIEENMIGYFSWIYSSPHSKVEDGMEFLRLTSGIPHPICNCVYRARFPEKEVDNRIESMLGFFRAHNLPMTWLVGPCTRPSDLGKHLVAHGMAHELDVVGMTIDLDNLNESLPIPEGIVIKRVMNDKDMGQYMTALGVGFEFPEIVTVGWGQMDASHGYDVKLPRTNYVAMLGGVPASSTALFRTRDTAGIYCVATVPEMRRRGAATALIVNALRQARDEGFKIAQLQAKAMGASVYRRIGFAEQPCKIGWYVWQPPASGQKADES